MTAGDDLDLLRRAAVKVREDAQAANAEAQRDATRFELATGAALLERMPAIKAFIAGWRPSAAIAVADWLRKAAADLWAHGPFPCNCSDGCDECDDLLWAPHVRSALAFARDYLREGQGR